MEKKSRKGNAPRKFRFGWDGIIWGTGPFDNDPPSYHEYTYYFYWWNWLPRKSWYFGFQTMYYDGYHFTFGFVAANWSWNFDIPFLTKWLIAQYKAD